MDSVEQSIASGSRTAWDKQSLSGVKSDLLGLSSIKNQYKILESSMSTCTSVMHSPDNDVDNFYAVPTGDDCCNYNYDTWRNVTNVTTFCGNPRQHANRNTKNLVCSGTRTRRSQSVEAQDRCSSRIFTRANDGNTSSVDGSIRDVSIRRANSCEWPVEDPGTDYTEVTQTEDVDCITSEQSPTCYDESSDGTDYRFGDFRSCLNDRDCSPAHNYPTRDYTECGTLKLGTGKYGISTKHWNGRFNLHSMDHGVCNGSVRLRRPVLPLNSWGSDAVATSAASRYDEEFPSLPGQQSNPSTSYKDVFKTDSGTGGVYRQDGEVYWRLKTNGYTRQSVDVHRNEVCAVDLTKYSAMDRCKHLRQSGGLQSIEGTKKHVLYKIQKFNNISLPENGRTNLHERNGNLDMDAVLETVTTALLTTEVKLNRLIYQITPSKTCKSNKLYIFNVLKRFIKYALGDDTEVYLTGSTAYDIDIDYSDLLGIQAHSDMDVEVIAPMYACSARAILRNVFNDFCHTQSILKKMGITPNWAIGSSSFKLVDTARVPIIIMQTKNGIQCDISANASNAIKHSQCFNKYIEKHSMLRNLMRLIKHWLKFRGIPAMKEGGFPTILWMLIFCDIVDTGVLNKKERGDVVMDTQNIFDTHGLLMVDFDRGGNNEYTLLGALEQCFKVISQGTYMIDMVNRATSGYNDYNGSRFGQISQWRMGDIGKYMISLIEMEPNVPFATWLIFYFEINRAVECLKRYRRYLETLLSLVVCLRAQLILKESQHVHPIENIQVLIQNVEQKFGYSLHHILSPGASVEHNIEFVVQDIADELGLTVDCDNMITALKLLINWVIREMPSVAMSIFGESYDRVYSIPASIEPPTPLIVQHKKGLVNGMSAPKFHGAMWKDNGWFIVAIDGKLHMVQALKICVCWESWWSTQFISRRDTKTIIHGFIYKRVTLEMDDTADGAAPVVEKPPAHVLLRDSGMVLFRPCDVVSRLYVMKVTKTEPNISPCYYSSDIFTGAKTLYVLPEFEGTRFDQLTADAVDIATRSEAISHIHSPLPRQCVHCGMILLNQMFFPKENKVTLRQVRNLRTVLCSPQYMEYYRCLKASLLRIDRNLRIQPI
ncbi:erythrocyte membrane-associated antigen, putative [Babesia ovis]|uniref:Erythrocyte membrane-associated antigen, putative n=1 Tax=Babesia ovis TaxID=5869 RepID=A0A9W5WU80_BABOV|nr:erythrocyte membrane-associated antigen, putative [Babesia ovis]